MDFSQSTGKDGHSFTSPIPHVSRSTQHKLDELIDLVEELTQPANTLFRYILILRVSTQECAGNYHAAWFSAL